RRTSRDGDRDGGTDRSAFPWRSVSRRWVDVGGTLASGWGVPPVSGVHAQNCTRKSTVTGMLTPNPAGAHIRDKELRTSGESSDAVVGAHPCTPPLDTVAPPLASSARRRAAARLERRGDSRITRRTRSGSQRDGLRGARPRGAALCPLRLHRDGRRRR